MSYDNANSLWEATHTLVGVQSRAEEDYLRQIFQQTRKGNFSVVEYLKLVKLHSDNLLRLVVLLYLDILCLKVFFGLDEEYNLVVVVIQNRVNILWLDMQSKLLSFEKRL